MGRLSLGFKGLGFRVLGFGVYLNNSLFGPVFCVCWAMILPAFGVQVQRRFENTCECLLPLNLGYNPYKHHKSEFLQAPKPTLAQDWGDVGLGDW